MSQVIPDFIDSPPQIILWEADEIAPTILFAFIGILSNTLTYMIPLMYFSFKFFAKFKNSTLSGYLVHVIYRVGLAPLNSRFNNGAQNFYHE